MDKTDTMDKIDSNPSTATPPPPATASPRSRRRWLLRLLALPAAAAVLAGAYSCATYNTLRREIRTTPRDPKTGVVLGAEALTLDPPAAADTPTTACLLVHGFITSRADFGNLGRRLADAGFHVEMMRLPGHGTTPEDFGAQTPETMIAAVREAYQRLRGQYRAVYVIGFSMGGALSTLLAADEPVDRLVLAAPYFGVTYRWFYVLPAEWWQGLLGWSVPYVIKSDGFIKINDPEVKKKFLTYRCIPTRGVSTLISLGRRANESKTLEAIRCPVLVIMAKGDYAASPPCAKRAVAGMKNAQVQTRWLDPRNHHHIFLNDDHVQTEQAIIDFLKG